MFGDPEESIIVIPEIAKEAEDFFELNSHVVIYNNATNQITHTFFESSKTNGWVSDAVRLDKIKIDTSPYILDKNTRAFSLQVYYLGNSKANPYSKQTHSLFIRKDNSLKKVLHNFNLEESIGEWDTNCKGEFSSVKSILKMSKEKTNGYFDIIIESNITETKNFVDDNGECDSKEAITNKTSILKFNGEMYNKL